jgi:predicted AlkP superfamily phosphohydrolase/phosphomutase
VRVLVIGIDGASPLLVDRWIDRLPNFRRFRDEGVLGPSVPPCPAQTPVAWTTFLTGQNPGRHGIFSFVTRRPGSYERSIARPDRIRSRTLFQVLSAHGKRLGAVNVPMSTYTDVNGVMIPGFLDRQEGQPQPARVAADLEARFGSTRLVGDVETEYLRGVRDDPDRFFARVDAITEQQRDVCLHLMAEEPWDLFMTVFMGGDRVQHFFWKHVDPQHPDHVRDVYSDRFEAYYRTLDRLLGEFLAQCPRDAVAVLVSDHGFCPVAHEVILNNYLADSGFAVAANGDVDHTRSRAVAYGYGDVWVNLKGREPHGVVAPGDEYEALRDAIVAALEAVTIDGTRPVKRVVKREVVYWGAHLDEAPDLVTVFQPGWQAARRPAIVAQRRDGRYVKDDPLWSGGHDGTHDPVDVPGILGFLGPRVDRGTLPATTHLWDVAPTILRIMGLPVPPDMDGAPLPLRDADREP